ncbi:MAG TPA: YtcA family lipoprotein [Candidatus Acidoferrum sp.]
MSVAPNIRSARCVLVFFLQVPLLVGCSRAPSVEVLGSFFPAWLVCFIVAIVLTVLVRFLIARLRVKVALPILMYLGLAAFFTFALWLVFFY